MKTTNKDLGVTSQIGEQLKALYRSIEEEPIPDHFLDLLEKLDEAETRASSTMKECE